MIIATYKYNPSNFSHVLGLSDDLAAFYQLHSEYLTNKTQSKRFTLEKKWEELFFTIKHREIEGGITKNTAHELQLHLDELLDESGD